MAEHWLGRGCVRSFLKQACESCLTMACSLATSKTGNHVQKAIKKPMTKQDDSYGLILYSDHLPVSKFPFEIEI